MFGRNDVSDKELSKTVNSRVARTGTGARVTALVNRGVVTLLGNLQYAGQRIPVVNAASRVSGVRQVIDQMQIPQKKLYSAPRPAITKNDTQEIVPVAHIEQLETPPTLEPSIAVVIPHTDQD